MGKLRPTIENLRVKCMKDFVPARELSYNESTIKCYGKHSCKQFIRSKPMRFEYNARCNNAKNIFFVNFNMYQGNDPISIETYQKLFAKSVDTFCFNAKRVSRTKKYNLFSSFALLK